MKIDITAYETNYHQNGKFIDNWQEGIKLLPFNSNPSSAFDKKCGLHGTTGEFFRLWTNDGSKAIEDFDKSVIEPVRQYLLTQKQMPQEQIGEFIRMLKDILLVNGNINISDSSFLKFIPLMPSDENIGVKDRKKYSDGQKKLANYLLSMLPEEMGKSALDKTNNLFTRILKEALTSSITSPFNSISREYTTLPYIKETFTEDLKWMMEQDEAVKVKYLHLFLHFYACYSVTQTIVNLNPKKTTSVKGPAQFYFILNSEKASVNHDAVVRGWSYQIPKPTLDKLYGKSQALDILNSVLGGNIGYYSDVFDVLSSTPFEENRDACNELLKVYQAQKREVFSRRTSEEGSIGEIDTTVNSYCEFFEKLEYLCTGLQSPSYISRMRKKVIDLLSVRFLQSRRGNFVLVLDNEMLTFLIALFTKSRKTKLEDMYKRFNSYGIHFNRGSRMAIEEYLLKLNLLDRKSDSGEAQYVKVVL
jgi:DNA phosphorothioation-dependent restriction protein DptG